MDTGHETVDLRRARDVRLVERNGVVVAYPQPHRTPVLPSGWAPLSREQQNAVLRACDAAPDALILRLGSVWDAASEYRVYQLADELWAGLSIVTKAIAESSAASEPLESVGCNRRLLGLACDTAHAVRIALDFYNWDLDAQGHSWRLAVNGAGC